MMIAVKGKKKIIELPGIWEMNSMLNETRN